MNDRKVYPLKCQIRAEGTATRIDVYDDIGGGSWFSEGVSAADFAAQVAKVKGDLEVHINSGGGDVFDGIAIGNALGQHKGRVTTVVDGWAASIASVIAQAADERIVQPGSMMMIHDAWGACVGSSADMAKFADDLDKVSGNIASIYADRAGGDADGWRDTMRAETWYTADEAVKAGLADKVGDGRAELAAGIDLAAYVLPGRIAAALRKLPRAAAAPAGHMCGEACGAGCQCQGAAAHLGHDAIRAIVREELHVLNAAADESSWDGPAAMSWASKQDNPEAAYRAICAGEKNDGEPDTQAHWALPHHKHAGDAPNRAGVSAALGRIGQTQDLADKPAAQAHLEAHQRAMGSSTDNHADMPAWLRGTSR